MTTPILVTGDDFALPVTLTVSGAAYVIPAGAVITAALVGADHVARHTPDIAQPEANAGSAWASGTAGIAFNAATTSVIDASGYAQIEIQVAAAGSKATWFVPVRIVLGHVA
jgi:hypothetical protein